MSNVIKSRMVSYDTSAKKIINPFEQLEEETVDSDSESKNETETENEAVDETENETEDGAENETETKEEENIAPLITKDITRILKEKEQMLRDQEADLKVKYKNVIESAEAKANDIIEEAKKEASALKEEAVNEGKTSGYEQGIEQAATEIETLKEELEKERNQFENEYNNRVVKFERDFINIFVNLCEKMFGIIIDDKQDVLYHIINRTISDIEKSNNYLIRVSRDDYEIVNSKKQLLYDYVSEGSNIEIVESETLTHNKCLIETDNSVIDCSVDTQIKNLITDLELLSKL